MNPNETKLTLYNKAENPVEEKLFCLGVWDFEGLLFYFIYSEMENVIWNQFTLIKYRPPSTFQCLYSTEYKHQWSVSFRSFFFLNDTAK